MPRFRPSTTLKGLLVGIVVGGALLALGAVGFRRLQSPEISPAEVLPPGRWHFQAESLAPARQREELARLISLPYLGAGAPAAELSGVVRHLPELASPGLNLYVSGHRPEARLLDMEGNLLHRWSYSFERAFPGRDPTVETTFWRRAHPFPNGDLLVIFQGGGMIKLDRESRLLWRRAGGFYNDLFVEADGRIFTIGKEARVEPRVDPRATVLEDFIVELDQEGGELARTSLLTCLLDSPWAGLLHDMATEGDIFHTNTVEVFDGSLAEISPLFRGGHVLVSLREVDLLAVVDPGRRRVVWASRGSWKAQHQPTLLPDGRLLLFDNRGAASGSRVLELDPVTGAIGWQYPGPDDEPLSSPEAGSSQRLANGNTLITESERGRALEVTRAGEIVWEFVSPHRGGPRRELVATLFEVLRLSPAEMPFARTPRRPPATSD